MSQFRLAQTSAPLEIVRMKKKKVLVIVEVEGPEEKVHDYARIVEGHVRAMEGIMQRIKLVSSKPTPLPTLTVYTRDVEKA